MTSEADRSDCATTVVFRRLIISYGILGIATDATLFLEPASSTSFGMLFLLDLSTDAASILLCPADASKIALTLLEQLG